MKHPHQSVLIRSGKRKHLLYKESTWISILLCKYCNLASHFGDNIWFEYDLMELGPGASWVSFLTDLSNSIFFFVCFRLFPYKENNLKNILRKEKKN